MRRLRIWCAALAAVAGSVTPVAAGTALPTLAGTTTITGTTTSYVRLAVPRRAVLGDALFLAKRDAIRVSGGRHLVGFAVVREQRGFRGPVYVGGRFSFFRRLGVPVGVPLVLDLSESPSPSSDGFVLTKGSYRFYLVTDGTAASVTFRFPGLTGSRVLRTSVPAAAGTAPTPPSVDVTAGAHAAYTFGSEYRSPRDVLAMSALLMRTDIHTESVYTNCDQVGRPSGPNPYLPPCPSVGNDRIITPFVISDELVEDDQVRTFYGGLRSGAGEYGRGGTLLTATPAEDVDAGQFWLTL